jgi:predicted transcriptional regulator
MSIRIRPDIKEGIQGLAKDDRRTVSAYIEKVLADHLAARAKKSAPRR